MRKNLFYFFVGLGLSFPFITYPQEDSSNTDSTGVIPHTFLDPAFLGGNKTTEIDDTSSSDMDNKLTGEESEEEIPSIVSFHLDLLNLPRYNLINDNNLYDPRNNLYFPTFDDFIQIHTDLRYTFWQRRLAFNWSSSLYSLHEKKDSSKFTLNSDTKYYLNELNLKMTLGAFIFGLGKINISEGTAFIKNPTDFLNNEPDFSEFSSFYKSRPLGGYQVQVGLLLKNWEWYLAYLPLLDTGNSEFSRPYPDENPYFGEVWSRLSWQGENLKAKFFFYWNGYIQGGLNLTETLGDEVVIFFDGAARVISYPTFVDNGLYSFDQFYKQYRIEEKYEYRVPINLGVTYTPANLFTLAVELYINTGEELNYWDNHKNDLNRIKEIAKTLESSDNSSIQPLASEYIGLMNQALNYHDPLYFQPYFIGLSLFRNDAFSDYTTEIFNFASRLTYSLIDTNFRWENHIAWEAREIFSLGLFTSWYFGKNGGIFTSVPHRFSIGIVTQMKF